MKTTYYTSLGDQNSVRISKRFIKENVSLPAHAHNEKLFQTLMQWSLIGYEDPGYNFYVDAVKDKKMDPSDPIGTVQIRIDYDAVMLEDKAFPAIYNMHHSVGEARLFDIAIDALCAPHDPLKYPEHGVIKEIRVKIKIDSSLVMEKTYWPVQASFNEVQPGDTDL